MLCMLLAGVVTGYCQADSGKMVAPSVSDSLRGIDDSNEVRDTLLMGRLRNSRIGFNSFIFQNHIYSALHFGRQHVSAYSGGDLLYNKNIGRKGGRFVQQDYGLGFQHRFLIGQAGFFAGQRADATVFAVNGNRLLQYLASAGWRSQGQKTQVQSELFAGIAADKRGPYQNQGAAYGIDVAAQRFLSDSTLMIGLGARIQRADIAPRQNEAAILRAEATQMFGSEGAIGAKAELRTRKVEDYLGRLIQSIRSDSILLAFNVSTVLGAGFSFRSENEVLLPNRSFAYRGFGDSAAPARQNVGYKQLEARSTQTIFHSAKRIRQSVTLELGQRNRNYSVENNLGLDAPALLRLTTSEKVKNIEELNIGYLYTGLWQASRRTTVGLNTVSKLLRVSTASVLNDQDRDEALYTVDVQLRHKWSARLRSGIRVSGSQKKIVFLANTQSAQNFTERIVRLEPSTVLALGPMTWTANYGVWATYNVRDFEQESDKNRSNRILIISQQIVYRLPQKMTAQLDFSRRENRIALLNWKAFSESPIDTVVITEWHPKIGKQFEIGKAELMLQIGYKSYLQSRRFESGIAEVGKPVVSGHIKSLNLQHGPSIATNVLRGERLSLYADTWLQWAQTKYKFKRTEEPIVGQSIAGNTLRSVTRQFYLFFNLQGTFLF